MKKYVMLAVATLMMVSLTMAQPGQGRGQHDGNGPGREGIRKERKMEMNPQAMVDHLAKQVQMTDVEKAKALELFKKQAAKREAMQQEFKRLKEKAEADRKAAEEELKLILGPEKFIQLQAQRIEHLKMMNQKMMKHKMMKKHQKEGPGRKPAPECVNK